MMKSSSFFEGGAGEPWVSQMSIRWKIRPSLQSFLMVEFFPYLIVYRILGDSLGTAHEQLQVWHRFGTTFESIEQRDIVQCAMQSDTVIIVDPLTGRLPSFLPAVFRTRYTLAGLTATMS